MERVEQNLSFMVHDSDVDRSCMKIDPAIELMLTRVESHKAFSLG